MLNTPLLVLVLPPPLDKLIVTPLIPIIVLMSSTPPDIVTVLWAKLTDTDLLLVTLLTVTVLPDNVPPVHP